jgi:hypothetical protein
MAMTMMSARTQGEGCGCSVMAQFPLNIEPPHSCILIAPDARCSRQPASILKRFTATGAFQECRQLPQSLGKHPTTATVIALIVTNAVSDHVHDGQPSPYQRLRKFRMPTPHMDCGEVAA